MVPPIAEGGGGGNTVWIGQLVVVVAHIFVAVSTGKAASSPNGL